MTETYIFTPWGMMEGKELMMCYRDRTWCSQPNCANKCGRKFTEQDKANAIVWWGDSDFPLAVAEFCNDEGNLKQGI